MRSTSFLDELQRREQALHAELENLRRAQEKIRKDSTSLAFRQSGMELSELSQDLAEQELRVSMTRKSTSTIDRQTTLLSATAADIRRQLESAQSQLEDTHNKVVRKQREMHELHETREELRIQRDAIDREDRDLRSMELQAREVDGLVRSVRRKADQVEKLKDLADSLQADVAARESEVCQLEAAAAEHEQEVERARERRALLDRRRSEAEARKEDILATLALREKERQRLMSERDAVRIRREAAEREEEELDRIEGEVRGERTRLEELHRREAEMSRLRSEESEQQREMDAIRGRMSERASQMRHGVDSFLARYESESALVEQKFERMEQAVAQKRAAIELEQEKWVAMWNNKHRKADEVIADLERKLKESETSAVLKVRLRELQNEHADLLRRIDAEQEEIARLAEGPGSERDLIEKMERETRDERERIAKLERDLESKVLQQQAEEDELDNQEEELRTRKDDLNQKMRILQLRETAGKRMLELYEQQLSAAEQRCENLRAQRKQIEDGT